LHRLRNFALALAKVLKALYIRDLGSGSHLVQADIQIGFKRIYLEYQDFFHVLNEQLVGFNQGFWQNLWGFQDFAEKIDDHDGLLIFLWDGSFAAMQYSGIYVATQHQRPQFSSQGKATAKVRSHRIRVGKIHHAKFKN
jgi:hypothetical protein